MEIKRGFWLTWWAVFGMASLKRVRQHENVLSSAVMRRQETSECVSFRAS